MTGQTVLDKKTQDCLALFFVRYLMLFRHMFFFDKMSPDRRLAAETVTRHSDHSGPARTLPSENP